LASAAAAWASAGTACGGARAREGHGRGTETQGRVLRGRARGRRESTAGANGHARGNCVPPPVCSAARERGAHTAAVHPRQPHRQNDQGAAQGAPPTPLRRVAGPRAARAARTLTSGLLRSFRPPAAPHAQVKEKVSGPVGEGDAEDRKRVKDIQGEPAAVRVGAARVGDVARRDCHDAALVRRCRVERCAGLAPAGHTASDTGAAGHGACRLPAQPAPPPLCPAPLFDASPRRPAPPTKSQTRRRRCTRRWASTSR
jgi:hypothetical protein